jgi:aspartate ammonia-lyase
MLEMMNMVCYQVMGGDLAISEAAQAGQLELNVMMPVISFNLNFMIEIMGHALKQVRLMCVAGIKANAGRCREYAERSLGLATALAPKIGYSRAAKLAREAQKSDKTIRQLLEGKGILTAGEIDDLLNLDRLAAGSESRRRIKK